MNVRVYLVTDKVTDEQRLIRATTPAQAVRHAASQRYGVRVAAVETVIELLEGGAKVETAGEEPATEQS